MRDYLIQPEGGRRRFFRLFFAALAPLWCVWPVSAWAQKGKAADAASVEKLKEDLAATSAEVARLQGELASLQKKLAEATEALTQGEEAAKSAQEELLTRISELESALSEARGEESALKKAWERAQRLSLAVEGKGLYRRHCAPCHGEDGAGQGPAAQFLDQAPRSFTRGTYKFRSTPSGSLPTADDLARTIKVGVPGTAMPGWERDLSEKDIARLVAVLQSFSERFEAEPEEWEAPISIPEPPKDMRSLVKEGRVLYLTLGCDQCHGSEGRGDGPSRALEDEEGRPLLAADFTRGVYKSGASAKDLYRSIATGLDGTPMPAYYEAFALSRADFEMVAGRLSAEDAALAREYAASQPEAAPGPDDPLLERRRWALVAYLQSLARPKGFLKRLFGDPLRRYDLPPKNVDRE